MKQGIEGEDPVLWYSSRFREYLLPISDGGTSGIIIEYCPWCGNKLPDSLRSRWFDELESMGIDVVLGDDSNIPSEYLSEKWWKNESCKQTC